MRAHPDDAFAFITVAILIIAVGLMVTVGVPSCSTAKKSAAAKTYTVTHRDGRVWYLDGPPSGYGMNGFFQHGAWGMYAFRDSQGFVMTVKQGDCKVIEE